MAMVQEPTQEVINEFVGVSHGNFARVKELLEQYPTLVHAQATWGETPLGAAAQTGQREIAEYLLSRGAALDICTAAMLGMTDQVAAMLQADPGQAHALGAHDIPVIYYPTLHSYKEIAELLLAHGADINAGEGKETALHGAAGFGQTAMVEWLLGQGAEGNPKGLNGKTPLRVAMDNGHKDIGYFHCQAGGAE